MPDKDKMKLARSLGYGTLGTLVSVYAWANADMFGGYDGLDKKRKIRKGGFAFNDHEVPATLEKSLHANPAYVMAQTIATIKHTIDYYKEQGKEGGVSKGIEKGMGAALLREQPFARSLSQMVDDIQKGEAASASQDMLLNIIIPRAEQVIAERADNEPLTFESFLSGEHRQREATGLMEKAQAKIIGLREELPLKEPETKVQKAIKRRQSKIRKAQ
jgi:hypothetical protein